MNRGELLDNNVSISAIRMVRTDEGKRLRKDYESHKIRHGYNEHRVAEPRTDGVCNTISTVQKDSYLVECRAAAQRGRYDENGNSVQNLEVSDREYSNAITTVQKDCLVVETKSATEVPEVFQRFIYEIDGELYLIRIRRLTPRETWRLMDFSDEDFDKAASVNSNTQLYKQAGNSICRGVLMHLFGQFLKPSRS